MLSKVNAKVIIGTLTATEEKHFTDVPFDTNLKIKFPTPYFTEFWINLQNKCKELSENTMGFIFCPTISLTK